MGSRRPFSVCWGQAAFTAIELIASVAIALVMAGILGSVPATLRAKARRVQCVENLKMVGLALRVCGTDSLGRVPLQVPDAVGHAPEWVRTPALFPQFQNLSNQLSAPVILACPADDRRPAQSFGQIANENISYFLGLELEAGRPAQWLAGDRNLTLAGMAVAPGLMAFTAGQNPGWSEALHNDEGNVLRADGSVWRWKSAALPDVVKTTGVATNRILMP